MNIARFYGGAKGALGEHGAEHCNTTPVCQVASEPDSGLTRTRQAEEGLVLNDLMLLLSEKLLDMGNKRRTWCEASHLTHQEEGYENRNQAQCFARRRAEWRRQGCESSPSDKINRKDVLTRQNRGIAPTLTQTLKLLEPGRSSPLVA